MARADGDRKVADEACEALSGDAQANCKTQAEQAHDATKARAQAQLDAVRHNSMGPGTAVTPAPTEPTGAAGG